MLFVIKKLLTVLLIPPINLIFIGLFSLVLIKRWPKIARVILSACLVGLFLLSTPLVSGVIQTVVQTSEIFQNSYNEKAQAIVILGCGVYRNAREYDGQNQAKGCGLERLHFGASLFNQSGLPVLVTGGDPHGTGVAEAGVMAQVLEDSYLVPVKWIEDQSVDTADNAEFSAKILRDAGIKSILLVTHSWHYPRAKTYFEAQGLQVYSGATIFSSVPGLSWSSILPSGTAFQKSYFSFREILGHLWALLTA